MQKLFGFIGPFLVLGFSLLGGVASGDMREGPEGDRRFQKVGSQGRRGKCSLTKEREKDVQSWAEQANDPDSSSRGEQAHPSFSVSWHSASSELFLLRKEGNKEGIFESKKCVTNFHFCVTSWAYILKLMMQIPFLKSELS